MKNYSQRHMDPTMQGDTLPNPIQPRLRTQTSDALRKFWYSMSVSVQGNSMNGMRLKERQNAFTTSLEISIMGGALISAVVIQIQEVVASQGGFTEESQRIHHNIFAVTSTLTLITSFYATVVAATLLVGILRLPSQ